MAHFSTVWSAVDCFSSSSICFVFVILQSAPYVHCVSFNTDKIYCSALKWRSIWDEKKYTWEKVRYTVLIGYPQVAKQFESISFYKLMNCKWTKNGIGIRKDQSQNSRFRFIFSIWTNSVSKCKYKLLSKIEKTKKTVSI